MSNQGHFCLGVKDLNLANCELSEVGVEFVSKPVVFFKYPDGLVLELMEFTD